MLGAAHSINHSLLLALPPLVPLIIMETKASLQTIGFLATIGYLLYGAGAIFGGILSDKLGESKLVALSLGLSGVSTFAIFFIPSTNGLALGLPLVAAWASLYHPTSNSFISKIFRRDMAEAMGLHGAGGNVGQVFAPSIAVLLGVAFGWRFSFLVFGLLAVLVSVYFLKIPVPKSQTVKVRGSSWRVFKIPGLLALLVYNVTIGLYFRGTELFFPVFLVRNRGLSVEFAGLAASLVLLSGVLGLLLGGKVTPRVGGKRVIVVSSIIVLFGLLFLFAIPDPLLSLLLFVLLYGVSYYAAQPASNFIAGLITPEKDRGLVYGILFFVGFGLGSISAAIAGIFADKYGLESVFQLMLLFSALSFVSSLSLPSKTSV